MSTIYVVMNGYYSDWNILCAFTSATDAERYAATREATVMYSEPHVEEVTLDEVEVGDQQYWVVSGELTSWDDWIMVGEASQVFLPPSEAVNKFEIQLRTWSSDIPIKIKVRLCSKQQDSLGKILRDEIARFRYEGQLERELSIKKRKLEAEYAARLNSGDSLAWMDKKGIHEMRDEALAWGVDWDNLPEVES